MDDKQVHRRPGRRAEASPAAIRAARESRDLSQSELARIIGVTPGLISRVEGGSSGVSHANLDQFARALRVSADDLLADSELDRLVAEVTGRDATRAEVKQAVMDWRAGNE
jgi:transcriptional regulator with XRE-family HTH domain